MLRSLVFTVLCSGMAALAQPAAPLLLHFMDQPPSSGVDESGRPQGDLVDRMRRIEAQTGLRLQWQLTPLKRSLQDLRDNREPFCVLGMYRNAERESYVRFSRVLLAGYPQFLVARPAAAALLRQQASARAALQRSDLRLLVFDGVSYGDEIDAWIRERQGPTVRVVSGPVRLIEMLNRDRADFGLVTARGFETWRRNGVAGVESLVLVSSPALPPPPPRHIACSMQVSEATMRLLDQAIELSEGRSGSPGSR